MSRVVVNHLAIPTKKTLFYIYKDHKKEEISDNEWNLNTICFSIWGFQFKYFLNIFQSFSFRRSEYLGMMTVMRVKFNMVALVFFLCLVFSIIHKGRELKKKGHNLDDCSEEKVVMLRLKYLLELKEERDKFDLAAKANKS